ncbi:ABC transporter substrate-binding protein [Brachybacterium sp. J153]|uniref:ABC transporter substrate-binding protein n=1 Tax=Brachybacterium sp. J153 TaxID=3116488 RepID=UPI002E79A909|nr:extracellular solute-binding protein [Brachybacterium sp. J153]MEE1619247.1 extracellular solute-binding protein [Brachybacterium sp. J153]
MPTRRQFLLTTAATGLAGVGALSACSRPAPELEEGDALRMRVWSEQAASAYAISLAAFTESTGVTVEVEVLTWDDYWKQMPLDAAAGTLPDVIWMNTANLAAAIEGDHLLEAGPMVGSVVGQWDQIAADQYTVDGALWGVPQYSDQSLLVAHDDLVSGAGGDATALGAEPGAPSDALRDLARAITVDGEGRHPGDEGFDAASRTAFGFGAHLDRSAVLGPFVAGQGGRWQDEEGAFTLDSAEAVAAIQYLADLTTSSLAPDGTETTQDPARCRNLFLEGRLGLLQTGTYDLGTLGDGIAQSFPWSVHPVIPGPRGARPLVHAVAAVAVDPDDEDREAAIGELMSWLGTVDGQRPLAENRIGIPGHRDLRSAWEQAWSEQGVDVSAIGAPEEVAAPEHGLRSAEGTAAALGVIAEVFRGEAAAAEAMPRAQAAAEAAVG